jgi:hypothetical protein
MTSLKMPKSPKMLVSSALGKRLIESVINNVFTEGEYVYHQ